jgi:diguanylate cyclase (GGDEF)-like protein
MEAVARPPAALAELGAEVRTHGWALAFEIVQEGLREDAIPSLARLGRTAQLGDMPTFIAELGRELQEADPDRLRVSGPLATLARRHARGREELGFAPREVVTEFLLLRRIVWRFVASRVDVHDRLDLFATERRLNDMIDRIVVECVVAYFGRATADLTEQVRHDPLTSLLNHQAFTDALASELERAARYDGGLTLVFLDVDRFKDVNDTYGHVEGDRILHRVADLARSILRSSDLAGRMGGDEFAVLLLEADRRGGDRFLHRLQKGLHDLRAAGELPPGFDLSTGSAHFPSEVADADGLLRLADQRQYAAKQNKQSNS